ncbi:MAG: hypothetical protein J5906_08340 [Acidaminococcaceae bacterium]|nr:hypothetical protein [Acidaminococcaceae bacterium]
MENKLASLADVIGELSCNIAAPAGRTAKKQVTKTPGDRRFFLCLYQVVFIFLHISA